LRGHRFVDDRIGDDRVVAIVRFRAVVAVDVASEEWGRLHLHARDEPEYVLTGHNGSKATLSLCILAAFYPFSANG
jgi:hypothetical protein